MQKELRFPLMLALGLVCFELLVVGIAAFGQPEGTRWLGSTIMNSSDAAVYLNYIKQGSLWLTNLYAVEPSVVRFDLFWSTLSAIHSITGVSPIVIHELARVLATVALAFSLYAASRSLTDNPRSALFASFLASCGVGLGWLLSVGLGAGIVMLPHDLIIPDLHTEFSVAPSLLGGAHMILSIALLLFIVRAIWTDTKNQRWIATALAIAVLTLFHPYFIPLLGTLMLFRKRAILIPALLPAILYYANLMNDPTFKLHHFGSNELPLSHPVAWIFTLAPAIAGLLWMKQRPEWKSWLKQCDWCIAWIVAATLLAVFLPVPWSRKLTEGLVIPIVFLTLPAWQALAAWFKRIWAPYFYIIALLSPFYLLMSQFHWNHSTDFPHAFNQPNDVFTAWSYLESKNESVTLSDDDGVALWTPAWTGQTTYYGHPHETPFYEEKLRARVWYFDGVVSNTGANMIMQKPITHILITKPAHRTPTPRIPSDEWTIVLDLPNAILLEEK